MTQQLLVCPSMDFYYVTPDRKYIATQSSRIVLTVIVGLLYEKMLLAEHHAIILTYCMVFMLQKDK